jgi:hypothetical protein
VNEATDARNEEKIEEVVMVPVYAPKNGRLQCKTVVAGSVPQDTRSNDCKLSPYLSSSSDGAALRDRLVVCDNCGR